MAVHYKGPDQRYAYTNVTIETEKGTSIATKYIGTVLNRDKKIYKKNGEVFHYDDETDSYEKITEEYEVTEYKDHRTRSEPQAVFFGSSFALYNFLVLHDLLSVLQGVRCPNNETFVVLIFFYLLSDWPNYEAKNWYEADIIRYIFPKAAMSDSSLSDLLKFLGNSAIKFDFLEFWSEYLQEHFDDRGGILIDTTGLPNKIKSRFSAWWNHNGEVEYGARLLLVCLKGSGIPIYYELLEGNIVDKSVLHVTILRVEQVGYEIEECIFDSGFVTGPNIDLYYNKNHELTIDYITRVSKGDKIYKRLLAQEADNIKDNMDYYVNYDKRAYFIKGFSVMAGSNEDNPAWLYLCLDVDARNDELRKLALNQEEKGLTHEQVAEKWEKAGWFGILSGSERSIEDVLPDYYERMVIEGDFDIGKHFGKLLPLRKHSDETLEGHILTAFIAVAIQKILELDFKEANMSLGVRLKAIKTQMAIVHASTVTINYPQKDNAAIYTKVLGISCPTSLPLNDGVISYTPPGVPVKRRRKKKTQKKETKPKRKPGRPPGAKNQKTLEREAREAEKNKRGPGRPAGSKNKSTLEKEAQSAPKRRGRPPGAKNKTPEERAAIQAAKVPKRRGRPPGAKNKSTLEREAREKELQAARENPKPRRGRPPGAKNKTPEEKAALEATKVKRPRGRPRKVEEEPVEKKEFHMEVKKKAISFRKITDKKATLNVRH